MVAFIRKAYNKAWSFCLLHEVDKFCKEVTALAAAFIANQPVVVLD